MKLVTVILQSEDAPAVLDALTERGRGATRISTAGGFLRKSNATLLLGVDDDQGEDVLAILRENSQTRTELVYPSPMLDVGAPILVEPFAVPVGGATIFILAVAEFVRLGERSRPLIHRRDRGVVAAGLRKAIDLGLLLSSVERILGPTSPVSDFP